MTTTTPQLRQEIHSRLTPLIDPAYLTKISELVPTAWTILGVRVPELRKLAAELNKTHTAMGAPDIAAFLDAAFEERCREEVLVGIFWLTQKKRHLTDALWPHIDRWLAHIVDWEMCDQLATGVGAVIVDRNLALVDDLKVWTQSDNEWRRRFPAALASALNQKGRAHVDETLRICDPLMQDPSAMVRKAVGWALREASKADAEAVFHFLLRHKAATPRGLLRESAQKLAPGKQAELLAP
ncbi:MAG: DNA alkylation repair protein [Caldilineaceae bacterium]